MGIMDKFLNAMRLNPDDDDDFYMDDYYDDDEYDEEPARKKRSSRKESSRDEHDDEFVYDKNSSRNKVSSKNSSKITPMRPTKKSQGSGNSMEVCVIKPTSVEDAREITETLLNNRTVVLNVEGLDLDIAQRIIDFTSGSCFAINGNLQKISNYIFIITPETVDLSGDFQNIVDAFEVGSFRTNY